MDDMNFVDPDWFHNERSYKAFMWASAAAAKLEELRVKGAMIFDGNELCEQQGRWFTRLDGTNSMVGFNFQNITQSYAGCCHDSDSGKIWLTMKEVKGFFGDIKIVMPKDIITLKSLL